MTEQTSAKIDLRVYRRVLWKRKKMVLLPVFVIVATAAIGSRFLQPVYRSSSVIMMEEGRPLARSFDRLLPDQVNVARRDVNAGTIQAKVTSSTFLERIAETYQSEPDSVEFESLLVRTSGDTSKAEYLANEGLVRSMASSISVRAKSPSVFEIAVEGIDPGAVFQLAEAVTAVFIEDALETQLEEVHSMYEFSVNQLGFYEKKLAESEEELKRFKQSVAVGAIREATVDIADIDDVRTLLSSFQREAVSLEEEVNSYRAALSPSARTFIATERLRALKDRLNSMSSELPLLLARHEWTSPTVLSANSRIGTVKDEIRDEMERIVEYQMPSEPVAAKEALVSYEMSRTDYESLQTIIESLKELIRRYERKLVSVPTEELELTRLEQEVEGNRQIYNMLLEQTKAANLSKALEYVRVETRYRVIEEPQRPLYPIRPNKAEIITMAAVVGLVVGLGLAVLNEYMDRSLKAIEDVQTYLGLPVLGTIPRIPSGGYRWKK